MARHKSKPKYAASSKAEPSGTSDRLALNLPVPPPGFDPPPTPIHPEDVLALCETYLPLMTSQPNYWEDRIIPPDVPRFRLD